MYKVSTVVSRDDHRRPAAGSAVRPRTHEDPAGTCPAGPSVLLVLAYDIVRSMKSMAELLFSASYWYTPMVAVSGSPASVNSTGPETPL